VAAAVAAGSPAVAVLLSGAITVAGTFLFATAPPAREWRVSHSGSDRPAAIANPALQIVLAATLLLGLGIGAIEVALPALAVHHGSHSAAGMLLVAATSAPLIVVGSLAAAFPLSLLAGVGFAPLMACQYSLVGALADRRSVTEAFAWTSTALVSGIAGGSAVAGALVQGGGIARTFAFGCLMQVMAAMIALSGRHRLASAVARGRSQALVAAVNS
jgi:hypothetical protein